MSAPEPIATGTLAKTPLPHLLVYLEQKRLSGTLALWTDAPPEGAESKQQDRILLLKGVPVAGKLLEPADTLRAGLLRLFARTRAPYAFYSSNLLGDDRVSGRVDPLSLIAESLRTSARDDVVQEVLQRFERSVLGLVANAEIERYEFQPSEAALVERMRAQPADLPALLKGNVLPEQYARRVLYVLAITKAIAPVADAPADAQPPAEAPKAKAIAVPAAPSAPAARQATPSGAPPLGPVSIKPPGASVAPSGSAPDSMHKTLDRLQSIPPAPGALNEELRQRWSRIVAKGRLIENQNYFEMLDLDKEAKASDARAKFYALAKEWHPDRLPTELERLREYVQIIFSYMSEASATLGDEGQRMKYLQSVREGGGTPATDRLMQAILDTAMEYERVMVMARKHQFDDAIESMKKILNVVKDDAEYYAMYASLLMQKFPGQEAPLPKMLETIDKALSLHAKHERANLLKAQILRRMGKTDEAFEYFQRVAEINPRNIDAMREVRVANMRAGSLPPQKPKASAKGKPGKAKGKGKAPEPGGVSGLFGKLFKKD